MKWFSEEKGYGFIRQDDGPDVFVHHSGIHGQGFRALHEGERVEFDIVEDRDGRSKAQDVVRLDAAEDRGRLGAEEGYEQGGGASRGAEERWS